MTRAFGLLVTRHSQLLALSVFYPNLLGHIKMDCAEKHLIGLKPYDKFQQPFGLNDLQQIKKSK
jgi:hypothetical protein